MCHLDATKKICLGFLPQETQPSPPYFAFQIISNFFHQRKHYLEVNTIVIPVTSNVQKIYDTIDSQVVAAGIIKTALSTLRLEDIQMVKNKIMKLAAGVWHCALNYYKKVPNITILESFIRNQVHHAYSPRVLQIPTFSNRPDKQHPNSRQNHRPKKLFTMLRLSRSLISLQPIPLQGFQHGTRYVPR
jgi:hypothetical protein